MSSPHFVALLNLQLVYWNIVTYLSFFLHHLASHTYTCYFCIIISFVTYSAERHVPPIFLIFTHHFLLFIKSHHLSSNHSRACNLAPPTFQSNLLYIFLFSKLPVHLLTTTKKIYHIFALFQTFFHFCLICFFCFLLCQQTFKILIVFYLCVNLFSRSLSQYYQGLKSVILSC